MTENPSEPTAAPAAVLVRREGAVGERRVALVPGDVGGLISAGLDVLVEAGAGAGSWFADDLYSSAGATVVTGTDAAQDAAVVLTVGLLTDQLVAQLHPGQTVIGMLRPLLCPAQMRQVAELGITAVSLDMLPRTLSRAQGMDALTSQASVAGYKAVLLAADAFPRFFPLLITAAGTAKPASVLVLGAGVAGLQAMATARRLGAAVTGYDVRPETRQEIVSVGARPLELRSVGPAGGEGGYARQLTDAEQTAQQEELNDQVARFDVVITTAQVPGRRPPLLVTAEALKGMRPGSVVVDLAASELGGNVEGSQAGATLLTDAGVTVIGADDLPSRVPTAASTAYSHNVSALLRTFVRDGVLAVDPADEIHAGVVITHDRRVVHPAVAALVQQLIQQTGDQA